jgi:hypothetical protein
MTLATVQNRYAAIGESRFKDLLNDRISGRTAAHIL